MPSNTKSNKLLRLHLTYTQLALAQAHLLHLQRLNSLSLEHNQALDLHLMAQSTLSSSQGWPQVFNASKAVQMSQGVPLYRVERVISSLEVHCRKIVTIRRTDGLESEGVGSTGLSVSK